MVLGMWEGTMMRKSMGEERKLTMVEKLCLWDGVLACIYTLLVHHLK